MGEMLNFKLAIAYGFKDQPERCWRVVRPRKPVLDLAEAVRTAGGSN